jgi:hypothetical protein
MSAPFAFLLAVSTVAQSGNRPSLMELGGDPARGVLMNYSPGGRAFDPALPTVVFVHGMNPLPQAVHFTMAQRLGEAMAQRGGSDFNVLGWDWNAATFVGLHRSANFQAAVDQGRTLAATLQHAGADPSRLHLIGQSSGCMTATAAARSLVEWSGRPIAQLTLLDPAVSYHGLVFDQLAAGSTARRVENYWTPHPSGYGRQENKPGIWNYRLDGPTPLLGTVLVSRSNHWHVIDWYISTAANPNAPGGFNTSVLVNPARP